MGTNQYLKETDESSFGVSAEVTESVNDILSDVKGGGDEAVRTLTRRFDDVERADLRVDASEIDAAAESLDDEERQAIDETVSNVRKFHEAQRENITGFEREFEPGITLGQRVVPIETAGVYIPGGRYPLVATPAMTIVPAKVAGVDRVVACAPPQADGLLQPAQLYAMDRAGVDEVYCIGGAQAIGAMAFGTNSIPSVDIVTGPGNVFTTEAKRQVFGHVGVDFLAGPTEVLIIADDTADPELVATDIAAQAEHDYESRAALIALSEDVARETMAELDASFTGLPTEDVARGSWEKNGEVVVASDRAEAIALANDYAMEHLQVMTANPKEWVDGLRNYGSLFLGHHSPVVFGDKAVGTNHCLPTMGAARYTSGIWVGTFLKTPTHQFLTEDGAANIAPVASTICEIEGTEAHRRSADARRRPEPDGSE